MIFRSVWGRRVALLAGVAITALAMPAFAQSSNVAKDSQKAPEWVKLNGIPTEQMMQSLIQMVSQMIQQAMQKSGAGGGAGAGMGMGPAATAGTYGYYSNPNYVVDSSGNTVNCTTTASLACPLYAVGYADGAVPAALKGEYMYDINYLTGYQAGQKVKGTVVKTSI